MGGLGIMVDHMKTRHVDDYLNDLKGVLLKVSDDCKKSKAEFFCSYEDMEKRLADYADDVASIDNPVIMNAFIQAWTDVYEGRSKCDGVDGFMDLVEAKLPHYTRFEKARIIGARALQISCGAPVMVDYPADMLDPVDIAIMEYDELWIPITVKN